jgi:hypothetical protein
LRAGGGALELGGQQQQRRAPDRLAGLGLEPLEEAERDVQHIDALLAGDGACAQAHVVQGALLIGRRPVGRELIGPG